MDIPGTICFVLSGSVCLPLVVAALRRLCAISKPANAPVQPLPIIYYYLPDGLTFKQTRELMFLRWLYESGKFTPGEHLLPEDEPCR